MPVVCSSSHITEASTSSVISDYRRTRDPSVIGPLVVSQSLYSHRLSPTCTCMANPSITTIRGGTAVPMQACRKAPNPALLDMSPETETSTTGPESRTPSSSDVDLDGGVRTGVAVGIIVFVVVLVILGLVTTGKRWKGKEVQRGGELPL
ncbi:uncharacterized protein PgNI_08325 [Pyricularia grisea]|uniref:Uncharacterized protein n=1 Tax=Pyricularia grisea TaxID=148305 RepID=A0A6P8AWU9_PYRGI|nr:uncharacterized protein PgNI_08325 [Pyricularia grisea]TLD06680.1 hypothetical protein PgNI_08325 [Pyricularia grisea]